jgi:aryl-alcohol dehydrogenase-like predicted oxidoreductase
MNPIGSSGLDVFPLALGSKDFGWSTDEATSVRLLDAYVAAGGNFIDTADGYPAAAPGTTESVVGRWMAARGNRDRIVLGTKVGRHPQFPGLSAPNIRAAADASLARLGTDHIDIYHAHFEDPAVPIEETAAAFDALVRAGKIRLVGVSHFSADRIREWVRVARANGCAAPAVMQPDYSLLRHDAKETDLIAVAADERLAVVPYFTSSSGFLSGRYRARADLDGIARPEPTAAYFSHNGLWAFDALETIAFERGVRPAAVALAWVRTRPGVVAPIVSARTAEALSTIIAAASLDLTDGERAALDEISTQILD